MLVPSGPDSSPSPLVWRGDGARRVEPVRGCPLSPRRDEEPPIVPVTLATLGPDPFWQHLERRNLRDRYEPLASLATKATYEAPASRMNAPKIGDVAPAKPRVPQAQTISPAAKGRMIDVMV
jgi:hypothetical protein